LVEAAWRRVSALRKEQTVTDDSNDNSRLPDVRTIKRLAALMSRHDLSEIDLRDGTLHVRLRRGARFKGVPVVATAPALPSSAGESAPSANKPEAAPEPPAKKLHEITSPTPGTFYAQEKPGSPPYVTVGTRVAPDKIVCQIEAMKIFNEIAAECSGVITEVLVENKQPVEFGTVLFRVDPSA
jgi:acetyl-CoA carboxylase biotin carboxyl carrier protein